jgi:hypothetical protein
MKKQICTIILFTLLLSIAKSQSLTALQYTDSLRKMIKVLESNQKLSKKLIITCMPINREEAYIFFSLDNDKSTRPSLWKLFELIEEKSKDGDVDIFRKYLLMSNYVDGYFAEHYFDKIEDILTVRRKLFCDLVAQISIERVKKFKDYYSACK